MRYRSTLGSALITAFGDKFPRDTMGVNILYRRILPDIAQNSFSWDSLNDILNRRSAYPADLNLVHNGRVIDRSTYQRENGLLDLNRLKSELVAGASIVLDSVDELDPRLREVTDDIMNFVGEIAACNLFATFASSQALTSHYDEVDTICLQVEGTKHWTIHGPGLPYPLEKYGDSDPSLCPREVIFEKVLKPGDVIHVPRGWWHTVKGAGHRSLHLTFAITRPTGYDWLRWALDESLDTETIRQSLDRLRSSGDREKQLSEIKEAFMSRIEKLTVDSFFKADRQMFPPISNIDLPGDINLDVRPSDDELFTLVQVFPGDVAVDSTRCNVTVGRESISLPREYASALQWVMESVTFSLTDMIKERILPRDIATTFLERLHAIGLLRKVHDPRRLIHLNALPPIGNSERPTN